MMRYIWLTFGKFHALRAWAVRRAAIRRWMRSREPERAAARYFASVRRYEELKKTSEKFFSRAKGRV